ncbi:hypothetical protein GCM10027033_07000 [Leucobacter ruminantium]
MPGRSALIRAIEGKVDLGESKFGHRPRFGYLVLRVLDWQADSLETMLEAGAWPIAKRGTSPRFKG